MASIFRLYTLQFTENFKSALIGSEKYFLLSTNSSSFVILTLKLSRYCSIFKVDEIYVYDDHGDKISAKSNLNFIMTLLKYQECPQYLRKKIFKESNDLKFAAILEPLGLSSHALAKDVSKHRAGIVTAINTESIYADIGLIQKAKIAKKSLPHNIAINDRVNVELEMNNKGQYNITYDKKNGPTIPAKIAVIEEGEKQEFDGKYWGFKVIECNNLSDIFKIEPKFTTILGTSDRGQIINKPEQLETLNLTRTLIVFGGIEGLEFNFSKDKVLCKYEPKNLFDMYINTCEGQGTRTIRTEEAISITLAKFDNLFSN